MSAYLVDGKIQEQTFPPQVWHRLCQDYRKAHGNIHRGWYMDEYNAYSEGVADALYLDVNDLQEYVRDAVEERRPYVSSS